jgi:hypothetical protein
MENAMRLPVLILMTIILSLSSGLAPAFAQGPSAEELARANNPLANIRAFNLQNYYVPSLYGLDGETANTFWARFAIPTGRVLWRASMPLRTVPRATTPLSGMGDVDLFGAYLIKQDPEFAFGVGPQVVFPTAQQDALGSGKWNAGLAAVAFAVPSPQLQYGTLLTWQTSVAGDDDREDVNILAAQVFGMWQLGGGNYLRSAPLWVFDLDTGDYSVPFGFGIGRVTKVGNTVYNIFIEPQFTILHDGVGQPAFQLFTALNLQFN